MVEAAADSDTAADADTAAREEEAAISAAGDDGDGLTMLAVTVTVGVNAVGAVDADNVGVETAAKRSKSRTSVSPGLGL